MSQPLIIKPTSKHTATVLFAHGFGDSAGTLPSERSFGSGWAAIISETVSRDSALSHIKWVLPSA